VRTRYGPPEVVHLTDVPAPEVSPGDVRVAVHATSVNRTDCGVRAGHPFFIRALTGLFRHGRTPSRPATCRPHPEPAPGG
jgi:NADPH:quinone reductase-like Zn-dependent oxidoreductase